MTATDPAPVTPAAEPAAMPAPSTEPQLGQLEAAGSPLDGSKSTVTETGTTLQLFAAVTVGSAMAAPSTVPASAGTEMADAGTPARVDGASPVMSIISTVENGIGVDAVSAVASDEIRLRNPVVARPIASMALIYPERGD